MLSEHHNTIVNEYNQTNIMTKHKKILLRLVELVANAKEKSISGLTLVDYVKRDYFPILESLVICEKTNQIEA